MRKAFVFLAALVVLSPALSAQVHQQQAILAISAQVVPSCRIDVQDGQRRLRLDCGPRAVATARVSLNGDPQAPAASLAEVTHEQVFLLPAAESVLASAGHELPFSDRPADAPVLVSIEF